MKKLLLLILAIFTLACSSDDDGIRVDLGEFKAITSNYPYGDLHATVDFTYLELLRAGDVFTEHRHEVVLFSSGELCEEETCIFDFKRMSADTGFAPDCLPGSCFNYLKVQDNKETILVKSKEELLSFFGAIDMPGEALLWARSNDYYWSPDDIKNGAIKETEDGFELVVKQTVKFCLPIQRDRLHLKITTDGRIEVLDREVVEILENACV